MLKRIKDLISQSQKQEINKRSLMDIGLAVCALLLEVADSDGKFSDDERAHVIATLKQRFALTDEEAEDLMEDAADHRKNSLD